VETHYGTYENTNAEMNTEQILNRGCDKGIGAMI
jgi:hypothetical protein